MSQPNFSAAVAVDTLHPVNLPTPRSSASSSWSGAETPWTFTTMVTAGSVTPRTDDKALPFPPSVLQPLRKHEPLGKAAAPRRRAEAPPAGLGWLALLPGMLVALLSAGSATTLLLYLTMRRDAAAPPFTHGFYVDELRHDGAPLLGLLAASVITNIIWFIGFPVLISLAAYCVAGAWLSYQQRPRSSRPQLLTPLQYALLFQLFSAPSPSSTYQAAAYLARPRSRVPAPAFFPSAVFLAASILCLSSLISIADTWLHAAAAVVVVLPAPALASNEALDAARLTPFLRGHYPLAPALAYLVLVYLHALLAALLTLSVACLRSPRLGARSAPTPPSADDPAHDPERGSTSSSATTAYPVAPPPPTALALAHAQLTDCLTPVAARLSTRGHARLSAHGAALFVEDANTARVEVGVWTRDGHSTRHRWGDVGGDRVYYPNIEVRQAATFALSSLSQWLKGAESVVDAKALEHTLTLLNSTNIWIQADACDMLANVANYESTSVAALAISPCPHLVSLLTNQDSDIKIRRSATRALSRLSWWLKGAESVVDAKAPMHTLDLLNSTDARTRVYACEVLRNLARHESTSDAILAMNACLQFVSLLSDQDSKVCICAIAALSSLSQWLKCAESVVNVKAPEHSLVLLHSMDARTRAYACEMLGNLAGHEATSSAIAAIDPYVQLVSLLRDQDTLVCRYAAFALSRLSQWLNGAESVVHAKTPEHALALLNSTDGRTRAHACELLGNLASHEVTSAAIVAIDPSLQLVSLLSDQDIRVCRYAAFALSRLGQWLKGAESVVHAKAPEHALALLNSTDGRTRAHACDMLGRLSIHDVVDPPCPALVELLHDPYPDVRSSATFALIEAFKHFSRITDI
ncbi:armadillo-type protein [Mycena pura]|uniref:Armadillo-type protein n=1 Tax=Mycena pura TaxID=153505 RepID=A0AAD6V5W2_9AGAR|nr:armadillo-type protein [Mycena pura]